MRGSLPSPCPGSSLCGPSSGLEVGGSGGGRRLGSRVRLSLEVSGGPLGPDRTQDWGTGPTGQRPELPRRAVQWGGPAARGGRPPWRVRQRLALHPGQKSRLTQSGSCRPPSPPRGPSRGQRGLPCRIERLPTSAVSPDVPGSVSLAPLSPDGVSKDAGTPFLQGQDHQGALQMREAPVATAHRRARARGRRPSLQGRRAASRGHNGKNSDWEPPGRAHGVQVGRPVRQTAASRPARPPGAAGVPPLGSQTCRCRPCLLCPGLRVCAFGAPLSSLCVCSPPDRRAVSSQEL